MEADKPIEKEDKHPVNIVKKARAEKQREETEDPQTQLFDDGSDERSQPDQVEDQPPSTQALQLQLPDQATLPSSSSSTSYLSSSQPMEVDTSSGAISVSEPPQQPQTSTYAQPPVLLPADQQQSQQEQPHQPMQPQLHIAQQPAAGNPMQQQVEVVQQPSEPQQPLGPIAAAAAAAAAAAVGAQQPLVATVPTPSGESTRQTSGSTRDPNLPKGVYKQGTKFRSQIRNKNASVHLGTFETVEEAIRAYEEAAQKKKEGKELKGKVRALPRGVYKAGEKYLAQIKVKKKDYHLGMFDTAEEAAAAFQKAQEDKKANREIQRIHISPKQRDSNGQALPRGVSKQKDRYEARIRVKGNLMYLGLFDTSEQASQAYLLACRYKKQGKEISKESIRTELAEMLPEARDQLLKNAGIKRKASESVDIPSAAGIDMSKAAMVPQPPSIAHAMQVNPLSGAMGMDPNKVVAVPEQPPNAMQVHADGPPIIPSLKQPMADPSSVGFHHRMPGPSLPHHQQQQHNQQQQSPMPGSQALQQPAMALTSAVQPQPQLLQSLPMPQPAISAASVAQQQLIPQVTDQAPQPPQLHGTPQPSPQLHHHTEMQPGLMPHQEGPGQLQHQQEGQAISQQQQQPTQANPQGGQPSVVNV